MRQGSAITMEVFNSTNGDAVFDWLSMSVHCRRGWPVKNKSSSIGHDIDLAVGRHAGIEGTPDFRIQRDKNLHVGVRLQRRCCEDVGPNIGVGENCFSLVAGELSQYLTLCQAVVLISYPAELWSWRTKTVLHQIKQNSTIRKIFPYIHMQLLTVIEERVRFIHILWVTEVHILVVKLYYSPPIYKDNDISFSNIKNKMEVRQ